MTIVIIFIAQRVRVHNMKCNIYVATVTCFYTVPFMNGIIRRKVGSEDASVSFIEVVKFDIGVGENNLKR